MKRIVLLLFAVVIASTVVGQDGITFKVEDLEKPSNRLSATPSKEVYGNLVKNPDAGIICNSDMPKELVTYGYHSFFDGMYRAYADHRPFVLSPDMIWLLISQGFAAHVSANQDILRDHFVDFAGKLSLVVVSDEVSLSAPADKWETVFPKFVGQLSENTKGGIIDILSADFSTTTPVERIASQITVMKALDSYFEFVIMYIACGIPEITLKGEPEDWQNILDKTKQLAQYDLEWWTSELVPLLEQFVEASKGNVDKEFWRNMFKYYTPDAFCGAPSKIIDGWIVKFFPYNKKEKRNNLNGISGSGDLPEEIVKVDLKHIELLPNGEEITTPLELWAGFIGLEQDRETFALTPKIGWMIRKKDTAVETYGMQQEFKSKSLDTWGIVIRVKEVPPELLELEYIKRLDIEFVDRIIIPDEMRDIKIDRLRLSGEISEQEIKRIRGMFPESNLVINNSAIDKNGEIIVGGILPIL